MDEVCYVHTGAMEVRHEARADEMRCHTDDDPDLNPQPFDDLLGADYDFLQTNLALPDPEDRHKRELASSQATSPERHVFMCFYEFYFRGRV